MRLQVDESSIQDVNKHGCRHLGIVIMPGHVFDICFHLRYCDSRYVSRNGFGSKKMKALLHARLDGYQTV